MWHQGMQVGALREPLRYLGTGLASEDKRPVFCINMPEMFAPNLPFKLCLWTVPEGGICQRHSDGFGGANGEAS